MKKVTVNEAVAAVAVADTLEAIVAVLMMCTKPQLHEVFLAVTGLEEERAPKSWPKEMIVSYYAKRTVSYRAREAFKVMAAEEKAEYIRGCTPSRDYNHLDDLLVLCSLYELFVINARLGGTYEMYKERLSYCHIEKLARIYLVRMLRESIHERMSWITMIANSEERKAKAKTEAQAEAVTLMAENSDGTFTTILEGHNVSYEEFSGEKPAHQDAQQVTHEEAKPEVKPEQPKQEKKPALRYPAMRGLPNFCNNPATIDMGHKERYSHEAIEILKGFYTELLDVEAKLKKDITYYVAHGATAASKSILVWAYNVLRGYSPDYHDVRLYEKYTSAKLGKMIAALIKQQMTTQAETSPVEDSAATVSAVELELYDDNTAAYVPDYEANEAVLQDTPENEYSGGYPLPIAQVEPEESKPETLGAFTFTYTKHEERKEITCTIRVEAMPQNVTNLLTSPGATIWKIYDESNKFVGAYAPMLDMLQIMHSYPVLCYEWALCVQFEEQFRVLLPELLNKAGYLDADGYFIPDGDEALRYLSYKAHADRKPFTMPETLYTGGNDKDNPLTWKDTRYRSIALRVAFAIVHYELGIEDYSKRRGGRVTVNYYRKRITALRKELYRLYKLQDKSATQSQASNNESISRTVFNFSECKTEETLRKFLSTVKVDMLEQVARTFKGFQPRTDGKRMTKKFLIDAIAEMYFPKQQEVAVPSAQIEQPNPTPVEEANPITCIEPHTERRKGLRQRLHELWSKRHEIRKAQRSSEISPTDYEALGESWERNEVEVAKLIREYKSIERRKTA